MEEATEAVPVGLIKEFFISAGIQTVFLLISCVRDGKKVQMLRDFSSDIQMMTTFSVSSLEDEPERKRGALLDLSCEDGPSILAKLSSNKAFGLHTEWLLWDPDNATDDALTLLQDLYILPGSGVTLARLRHRGSSEVTFSEVYRTASWSQLHSREVSRQKINEFKPFQLRGKRDDFMGVVLRSATVVLYPEYFTGLGSLAHPESDSYTQLIYPMAMNIAQQYNFSFSLLLLYDYGYKKNGSFTGLMGYLKRDQLDFGMAGLMMRQERMEAVDFAGNILVVASPLIFRQPSLSAVSDIFLLPFQKSVWIGVLVLSHLSGLQLAAELLAGRCLRGHFSGHPGRRVAPGDICMAIIGHFSQQGAILTPRTFSGELTLLVFSIFSFFAYIAYSAKIVALLQSSTNTIRNLQQLVYSPLTVGIQDVIYNKVYFQESQDETVLELYHNKILPRGKYAFENPDEGIRKVRSGLYAYKAETSWAYKVISETFIDREKCGLSELSVFLLPMLSVGVPKRSGHREHISRSMIWQRECGLFPRVVKQIFAERPSCNSKSSGYITVHLRDFKPALQLWVFGLTGSIGIFIVELFAKLRCRTMKARKNQQLLFTHRPIYSFQN